MTGLAPQRLEVVHTAGVPRPSRRRVLGGVLAGLVLAGLVAAPTVAADDSVLRGTVLGSDGRAVSALIGFDLRDDEGRVLGASGCVRSPSCPVDRYAVTTRVNFDLGALGGDRDDDRWSETWAVSLPEQAARVYVEVFPQGRRYAGTDHARYAAAFRRNLPVEGRTAVHLRLPLVCEPKGGGEGSAGFVNGYARDDDGPVRLRRVTAYSMEADSNAARPVLGLGVGEVSDNGYFRVPHLASGVAPGQKAGQRYQLIATAADGRVRRVYGVAVHDCRGVRADVRF